MKEVARLRKRRKVVAIDVDDVFWDLNKRAAQIAGIDFGKIITYDPLANTALDAGQRSALYHAYQSPDLFAGMELYPDAAQFGLLARDPRIEPWICSNSLSEGVIRTKVQKLSACLGPDWDLFQKQFHMIGHMKNSNGKSFPENLWLLVDDSPLNACKSGAEYILMPKKPWNTSGWAESVTKPIRDKIIYYDTPADACRLIYGILDAECGPLKKRGG